MSLDPRQRSLILMLSLFHSENGKQKMEFLLFLNPLISGTNSSTRRLLMCFESLLSLSLQEKENCVSKLTELGTQNTEAGTPVQADVQKGALTGHPTDASTSKSY